MRIIDNTFLTFCMFSMSEVKKGRTSAKRLFTRNANSLEEAINENDNIDVLNKGSGKEVLERCVGNSRNISEQLKMKTESKGRTFGSQNRFEKFEVQHSIAV